MLKLFKSQKKSNKYSALSENVLIFTISNLGTKIISFLLVPLYTYALSTQEYGTIDLLSTTASLLIPIITVNIQDAVLRFALDDKYDIKDVISTATKINIIGIVVVAIGVLFVGLSGVLDFKCNIFVYLVFMYVIGSISNILNMYLKARDRTIILALGGILNTILMCILNIVFLIWFKLGIDGYFYAYGIANLIAVIFQIVGGKIYKDIHLIQYNDLSRDMLQYSSPLVFNSLAWWINNALDRYIITYICGISINGIYSVAYKIPTILSTIQTIFYNAWSVSAIKEFDPEDRDGFVGNILEVYSFLSVISCSVIMIFNKIIARLLYAPEYYMAWKYVPFLLVGTVYNGLALFQGCLFTAVKQTKEVSRSTIVGAIVNTICNIILINRIGAIGAAIATMLGYMITYIMRARKLRSIVNMKSDNYVLSISYTFILVQSVIAFKMNNILLQIIILGLLLFIQRRIVKKIIKKFFGIRKN